MPRCDDCLDEFAPESRRFAVLKEDTSREFDAEERRWSAHLYQAFVCGDCAGWYVDHAIDVTEAIA